MGDIVTGIGGFSSNYESYASDPLDVFYEPKWSKRVGKPITVEYRCGDADRGEYGVPFKYEFTTEADMFLRLDNARIRGRAKVVKMDGTPAHIGKTQEYFEDVVDDTPVVDDDDTNTNPSGGSQSNTNSNSFQSL